MRRYMAREPYHLYEYAVGFRPPKVLLTLVSINVAVFALMSLAEIGKATAPKLGLVSAALQEALALHPRKALLGGYVWQFVTYSVVHANFWHLLFNMLALYWFGREMEELLGRGRFLGLYLTGAFVAGLAHSLAELGTGGQSIVIGASGAVFAVLVLFACYFPNRYVYVFFLLPMKVKYLVAILIGVNLLMVLQAGSTGIAPLAHLGGAMYGFVYYRYRYAIEMVPSTAWGWITWSASAPHARTMRKLKELSDKAARNGMDSLTPREREYLVKMSDALRRRRR